MDRDPQLRHKPLIGKVHVETNKKGAIIMLYLVSGAFALFGVAFCFYSIANDVSFTVLNAQIPGFIFGVVVTFLGVRYLLSVGKLRDEVHRPSSTFSWGNFRKGKRSGS